jgi:hypothetical protein
MPRFVVLTHDHPKLHWDFMLEHGETLRTWRLAQPPDVDGPIDAEPINDHRLAYLDYEGPVSGGRGEVRRWDHGDFQTIESIPERIVVRLSGGRIRGEASLERIKQSGKWIFRLSSPAI